MKTIRVIPRLDIKGPNLVKGIHLEGLRVVGDPGTFARYYYEQGADEIIYQDVVASLYERNSLKEFVAAVSRQMFVPMAVGGGIRSVDDIREILRAGADKVAINTAALKSPEFIRNAATMFGSSTITVSIEAIRHPDGKHYAYYDNGREASGREVVSWAKEAESLGAGEIFLTSVDRDGTGKGFDVEIIRAVSKAVSIPVVAHGGAGSKEDAVAAVKEGLADAVALASILHYDALEKIPRTMSATKEGNLEFARSGRSVSYIKGSSLHGVKCAMQDAGLEVRPFDPSTGVKE